MSLCALSSDELLDKYGTEYLCRARDQVAEAVDCHTEYNQHYMGESCRRIEVIITLQEGEDRKPTWSKVSSVAGDLFGVTPQIEWTATLPRQIKVTLDLQDCLPKHITHESLERIISYAHDAPDAWLDHDHLLEEPAGG